MRVKHGFSKRGGWHPAKFSTDAHDIEILEDYGSGGVRKLTLRPETELEKMTLACVMMGCFQAGKIAKGGEADKLKEMLELIEKYTKMARIGVNDQIVDEIREVNAGA